MKILWFTNTPCGASEKLTLNKACSGGWLYTLSKELAKIEEIELHIAFYWGNIIQDFKYENINYHPILRKGDNSKIGRWTNRLKACFSQDINQNELKRLQYVIEEVRPDIIHIHGTEENFGQIALYNLNYPIVLSIQGVLSSIHQKLFAGIPYSIIKRKEEFFTKINFNSAYWQEKILKINSARERQMLKNTQYIIGRTDFDKYCSLLFNRNRIYFEVNEIIRSEFYNNKWNKTCFSQQLIITTTISNGLYKGLETIYQTAKQLKEYQFNFKWQIIGLNSSDKLTHAIENILNISNKEINIDFLGKKNAEDITQILSETDIFCQVSHIENSSNSLCEAMMLGIPIIATFAGGTSSMLEHKKEGILIQEGDPFALGGAIIHMAQNFTIAKQMGVNARTKAISRHSPQLIINQLLSAYKQISNKSI